MKTKIGTLSVILICSLMLGCERSAPDSSSISIKTPASMGALRAENILSTSATSIGPVPSPWNGTSISSHTEINCYAVFVGGPEADLNPKYCREKADSTKVKHFGYFAGGVPAGDTLELIVPSGPQREVTLVGMNAASGSCHDWHFVGVPAAMVSYPRVIGSQTLDLVPGDVDVVFTVPSDLTTVAEFDECQFTDLPGDGTNDGVYRPLDRGKLLLTEVTTTGFRIMQEFYGDDDGDATVEAKYCRSPGCDPFSSPFGVTMDRHDDLQYYIGNAPTLSGGPSAGDTITVGVTITDPGGVNGPVSYIEKVVLSNHIYRSVGPGASSALAAGSGTETFGISGSLANFSVPLPPNVGVGDALEYDADGDTVIDSVAFLSFRISDTHWYVRDAAGGIPADTTNNNEATWNIFRAYTKLYDWEDREENSGLEIGIRNFDETTGRNIVAENENWKIALYSGTGTDNIPVDVNSWTTDIIYQLEFFTPNAPHLAISNHSHNGVYSAGTYHLQISNSAALKFSPIAKGVQISGLQVSTNSGGANADHSPIEFTAGAGNTEYTVANSIIFAENPDNAESSGIKVNISATNKIKIFNNIIYNFAGTSSGTGIDVPEIDPGYIYNNTVYGCNTGINVDNGIILKNNLVNNVIGSGYSGSADASSSHNLSSDSSLTPDFGSNFINATTVTFVNTGNKNFTLGSTDTAAIDQGVNLSSDSNLPIFTDITGFERGQGNGLYDIGAYEY